MSTTFESEMPLKAITAHPKNPRHAAVADDDMVASIRESGLIQPVVVAPHPDQDGTFILIAGHRRIDGATKAKRKHVPAIVRTDLAAEGQQIEAMVIENGHRLDLTPIEEAEGYAQLELLGYKPPAIAAAVGRSVTTIRARLGLLKLSATTRSKVHEGQLNIEDAIAIGEFKDDPATTKNLERAAATGGLRYELTSARQRRERLQRNAERVAELLEAGATEYKLPADKAIHNVIATGDVARVNYDPDRWSEHKKCLGYFDDQMSVYPSVETLCLKPSNHKSTRDKVELAREAERQKSIREREEKAAAAGAAATARASVLLDLIGTGTTLPATFRDLARALLPFAIQRYEAEWGEQFSRAYTEALNLPEPDRWHLIPWQQREVKDTLMSQHFEDLATASAGTVARAVTAFLVAATETELVYIDVDDKLLHKQTAAYLDLLVEAGHSINEHDQKILDAIAPSSDDTEQTEAS